MTNHFDAENENVRLTPDEASAVVRLWVSREWERQHWPTVADIAEALEIPIGEASGLLAEVRAAAISSGKTSVGRQRRRILPLRGRVSLAPVSRFAIAVCGLTGLFSLVLERLLA